MMWYSSTVCSSALSTTMPASDEMRCQGRRGEMSCAAGLGTRRTGLVQYLCHAQAAAAMGPSLTRGLDLGGNSVEGLVGGRKDCAGRGKGLGEKGRWLSGPASGTRSTFVPTSAPCHAFSSQPHHLCLHLSPVPTNSGPSSSAKPAVAAVFTSAVCGPGRTGLLGDLASAGSALLAMVCPIK